MGEERVESVGVEHGVESVEDIGEVGVDGESPGSEWYGDDNEAADESESEYEEVNIFDPEDGE